MTNKNAPVPGSVRERDELGSQRKKGGQAWWEREPGVCQGGRSIR